ncbi:hypothetical protein [Sphingomicrobium astaxanthinifaciens]|uniref:hypothetical protein n=1 Tax=Sphingomicrobium astaxanthinifaciens TaxID=1227949 RepID=UPI001FCC6A87|nr:hypothetical protein [Sphingomicrobium astaxanthinifaciens]MCJ7421148.1 hypothetical protein [Sphingomicrobium astaxanthinifaciens]
MIAHLLLAALGTVDPARALGQCLENEQRDTPRVECYVPAIASERARIAAALPGAVANHGSAVVEAHSAWQAFVDRKCKITLGAGGGSEQIAACWLGESRRHADWLEDAAF